MAYTSSGSSHSPDHLPCDGWSDVYFVPLEKPGDITEWHVRIVDSKGNEIYSEQGYPTMEACRKAWQEYEHEMGIQVHRMQ